MKVIFISISLLFSSLSVSAQEFAKQLSTARSSYASGKLEDARFAMQQMLLELDIITGKEILKVLPGKLQEAAANTKNDNVTAMTGFLGTSIHRDYGTGDKMINIDIISNSPLIAGINTILSLPLIGNSGEYKVIKVNGYKALLQKVAGENGNEFEVQMPLNTTLITLKAPGYTQDQLIAMINTLPVGEIAKMIQ